MSRRERLDAQLEGLYREVGPAVLGYLARRTATPEQAADLLGEVFVVLCRRRDDLPPPGEDRLWLFGIARNVLANHQRKAIRHRAVTDAIAAELHTVTTDPADVERNLDLHTALNALTPRNREIVQLAAWEGLTSTEIGTLLKMRAQTVRTRLHRARHRLRHDLSLAEDHRHEKAGDRATTRGTTGLGTA